MMVLRALNRMMMNMQLDTLSAIYCQFINTKNKQRADSTRQRTSLRFGKLVPDLGAMLAAWWKTGKDMAPLTVIKPQPEDRCSSALWLVYWTCGWTKMQSSELFFLQMFVMGVNPSLIGCIFVVQHLRHEMGRHTLALTDWTWLNSFEFHTSKGMCAQSTCSSGRWGRLLSFVLRETDSNLVWECWRGRSSKSCRWSSLVSCGEHVPAPHSMDFMEKLRQSYAVSIDTCVLQLRLFDCMGASSKCAAWLHLFVTYGCMWLLSFLSYKHDMDPGYMCLHIFAFTACLGSRSMVPCAAQWGGMGRWLTRWKLHRPRSTPSSSSPLHHSMTCRVKSGWSALKCIELHG